MHRFFWGMFLLLCLAVAGEPASVRAEDHPHLADLIAVLNRVLPDRMRKTHVPGAAVAVVQNGELAWSRGYGLADVASGRPVAGDSLFGVASISKTASAWGVMALVEARRVELDAPVERYLTRWRFPPSKYDSKNVTIRRLLNHTAGLNTPEYLGYLPGQTLPSIESILSDGDGRTPGLRLVSPPGEKFAYSDGGYLLLQLLVEEVSGLPFDMYMQQVVLNPLGLNAATFKISPTVETRTVTSYDPHGVSFPRYRFAELAPAGLYISAPDLARFVAAWMPGPHGALPGRGVLSPAAIDLMLSPQAEILFPENWIYAQSYGMGVFIDLLPNGSRLVSHMGGNLNGVTEFAALPESGDAIIVLTTGISGHEVFADAVDAWTVWLDSPPATLPRAIRASRWILFAVANLFGWAGLLSSAVLLWEMRQGKRRISLRADPQPLWLRLSLGLAPAAALLIYIAVIDPWMRVSMPTVAGAMALSAGGVCLAVLVWGVSRRESRIDQA